MMPTTIFLSNFIKVVLKFYESNDSTIINIVSLQFFNKFILVQSAITFIKQFHM